MTDGPSHCPCHSDRRLMPHSPPATTIPYGCPMSTRDAPYSISVAVNPMDCDRPGSIGNTPINAF
ncbi:hypothetical protein L3556_14435 [Candidatus Synechococcus calcipolaris G9]|uniref:Uncharacterized protein n=1 Tax=Candidatus Synechococcus calcipolaris G9 TaxID=1497997 RepID=A0ABT6F2M9_9SYNE|nr:hypothetical protein [Candidatus Synechococcus calcipolaris]MDG2992118.1 hypothetical protein [Candidatus Synechococcus calcipolaris G9]